MSGDNSTQSTSPTGPGSGVESPYYSDSATTEEAAPPPPETSDRQSSSYRSDSGDGETTFSWIEDRDLEDLTSDWWASEESQSGLADPLENQVITMSDGEHPVRKDGKTTIYDLTAEGHLSITGIPNTGFARLRPRDGDSVTIEIVDASQEICETIVVNLAEPRGHIFLMGGLKPDLTAIRGLPIESQIHVNMTAENLPDRYESSVAANTLYQLSDFSYIGDEYQIRADAENAVIDLVGNGTTRFHILANDDAVTAGHVNFVIRVSDASGKSDTIYLNNVHPTVKVNLFGGTLDYAQLSEAQQAMFPQNYDFPTVDDKRTAVIAEKMAALESQFQKNGSEQELFALLTQVVAVSNGNSDAAAVTAAFETFLNRLSDTPKQARVVVNDTVKILSEDYPELLRYLGTLGIATLLGNVLIGSDMTKQDLYSLFLLEDASGKGKAETELFLQELAATVDLDPNPWNAQIKSAGTRFDQYLRSEVYRDYASAVESGNLTLVATEEPSITPSA